jgi:carbon-monoxide dehydrogenase medium subunit
VIPASFDYVRVASIEEAIAALSEHGDDAKVLAGGHSLLPLMKLRLAAPSVVVDIGAIAGLSYVRTVGDAVAIGALTRHAELLRSPVIHQHVALLARTAGFVGDPQVRHRGTIGGSIAHGDPASDLSAAVLALGATLVVQGPKGSRELPVDDFFVGFLETQLEPDELLVEIRVPAQGSSGWSFQKFNRRAQDWAVVGCAIVRGDVDRVALVNMGSTTIRARAVEQALAAGASLDDAAHLAAEGTEPSSDINASADYRRHLARVLVRRGLEEASATSGPTV